MADKRDPRLTFDNLIVALDHDLSCDDEYDSLRTLKLIVEELNERVKALEERLAQTEYLNRKLGADIANAKEYTRALEKLAGVDSVIG